MKPQNKIMYFMLEEKIWNKTHQIDNSVISEGRDLGRRREEMIKGISTDKYFINT